MPFPNNQNQTPPGQQYGQSRVAPTDDEARLRAARDYLAKHPTLDFDTFLNPPPVEELVVRPIGPTPDCLSVNDLQALALDSARPRSGGRGSLFSSLYQGVRSKLPRQPRELAHVSTCEVCARQLAFHRRLLDEGQRLIQEQLGALTAPADLVVYEHAKVSLRPLGTKVLALTVMTPPSVLPGLTYGSGVPSIAKTMLPRMRAFPIDPGSLSVCVDGTYASHTLEMSPTSAPTGYSSWNASRVICEIDLPVQMQVGDFPIPANVRVEARSQTGELQRAERRVSLEATDSVL